MAIGGSGGSRILSSVLQVHNKTLNNNNKIFKYLHYI